MVKVFIDISLFTPDAAFGMISGFLDLPGVPDVGDSLTFDIPGDINADCDAKRFTGALHVTHRVTANTIMLEDLTAATPSDARAILQAFEKNGLVGDVWEHPKP